MVIDGKGNTTLVGMKSISRTQQDIRVNGSMTQTKN